MKDHVDKSMGIVTLIVEDLVKIKPTETLIFGQVCISQETKLFRCQEDDGVRPIRVYLTIMTYLYSDCIVQDTVRLGSTCNLCVNAPFVH